MKQRKQVTYGWIDYDLADRTDPDGFSLLYDVRKYKGRKVSGYAHKWPPVGCRVTIEWPCPRPVKPKKEKKS